MVKRDPEEAIRSGAHKRSDALHREDAARSTAGAVRFMKDKRKRTRLSEKSYEPVSRDSRPQRDDFDNAQKNPRHEGDAHRERHSYNPNFSKENKPLFKTSNSGSRQRKAYSDDEKWNRIDYDPSEERKSAAREVKKRKYPGGAGRNNRADSAGCKDYGVRRGADRKRTASDRTRRAPKSEPKGWMDNYPKYPAPGVDEPMRLNRYMAMSGVSSRREADEYIKSGQVTVNGVVVTELGTKINPGDEVRFNDKVLRGEKKVYIVMNKPKGYVTSMDDPHADRTVMDLVKNAVSERVYPVGRLDKNSLGVLLITNDGDLTTRLTHPAYNKKKIYQVTLDKPLTRADMAQIAEGITLDDGEIYADEISYVKDNKREVGIEIHSGRNRIVRRIFEHFGYNVQKLDRVYFAGLTKKNLKRGAWRFLTPKEVDMIISGKYE